MGKREETKANKLANQYAELRRREKELGAERQKLIPSVIDAMEKAEVRKIVTGNGSLILFDRSQRTFDIENAKEVLSDRTFKAITKLKVDTEVLDAKVKLGEIDPNLIDKFCKTDTNTELRLL